MKKLTKKKKERIATIIAKVTLSFSVIFTISFLVCLEVFQIKGIIDEEPYHFIPLCLFMVGVFFLILFFLEIHFFEKYINIKAPKKTIKNVLLSEEKARERKYGKVVKTEEYDNYKYEIRKKEDVYKAIILKKFWYDQYQTYDSYNEKYDEAWAEFDSSIETTNDLDIAINYAKDFIKRSEKWRRKYEK